MPCVGADHKAAVSTQSNSNTTSASLRKAVHGKTAARLELVKDGLHGEGGIEAGELQHRVRHARQPVIVRLDDDCKTLLVPAQWHTRT